MNTKLKISQTNSNSRVRPFKDLESNDFFKHDSFLYVKVDDENAFCFQELRLKFFGTEAQVNVLAEVEIKYIL